MKAKENDQIKRMKYLRDLIIHLKYNHYPSVKDEMIPVAEEAIEKARRGNYDHTIKLPEGAKYKSKDTMKVREAIESMHLESFIDYYEKEEEE